MFDGPRRVAIVVDREFGDRFGELEDMAVYACDSPVNRPWIDQLIARGGAVSFPWLTEESAEARALIALEEWLDDWGGPAFDAFDPWWSDIGFFGVGTTPELRYRLGLCGVQRFEMIENGFVASRREKATDPWPYPYPNDPNGNRR